MVLICLLNNQILIHSITKLIKHYCYIKLSTYNQSFTAAFSTDIVLRPLDDLSKVSATPNNKIVWVTSKESIFRLGVRMNVSGVARQHLSGKAVLTSFSSDLKFSARSLLEHDANHFIHMVEPLSRKLSKNLKGRMIQTLIRSMVKDMEQRHGP